VNQTCEEAINKMRGLGFDQFPVKNEDGTVYGALTAITLLTRLGKGQLTLKDPIKRACVRDIRNISLSVKLNELVRILSRNSFVLVDNKFFITFSDIFDKMHPRVGITQEEFDAHKEAASRNMMIATCAAGVVALVAGAIMGKLFGK